MEIYVVNYDLFYINLNFDRHGSQFLIWVLFSHVKLNKTFNTQNSDFSVQLQSWNLSEQGQLFLQNIYLMYSSIEGSIHFLLIMTHLQNIWNIANMLFISIIEFDCLVKIGPVELIKWCCYTSTITNTNIYWQLLDR